MSDFSPTTYIDPPGCYAGACFIKHEGTTQIISATDGPIYVTAFKAWKFSYSGEIYLEYGRGPDCSSPTILTSDLKMDSGNGVSMGSALRDYRREYIIFVVPPGNGVCVVSTTAPFEIYVSFKHKKPSECGGAWDECKEAP